MKRQQDDKKKAPKMYSIKKIKNHLYVYSWTYIPKAARKNEKKRFDWKYEGPLSGKGGEYIQKLEKSQQRAAWNDIKFIEMKEQECRRVERKLATSLTYSLKREKIGFMGSEDEQRHQWLLLNKEMAKEARAQVNMVFKGMDADIYREFIAAGGTIEELRERILV